MSGSTVLKDFRAFITEHSPKRVFVFVTAREMGEDYEGGRWKRAWKFYKIKKQADGELAAWKAYHLKLGYEIEPHRHYLLARKSGRPTITAGVHEYDPENGDRIWSTADHSFREVLATGRVIITPKEKKERKPAEPKPRRGRGKPAYV